MSQNTENQTATASTDAPQASEANKKKGPNKTKSLKAGLSRKSLRDRRRSALAKKIHSDKEFATAFFDAKSKRSIAKKLAYRKRHSKQAA